MIHPPDRTPAPAVAPVLHRGRLLRGANPHHRSTVFSLPVDPGVLAGRTTADLDPGFGTRFTRRFGALESLDDGGNPDRRFAAALEGPVGVPLVEVLLEAILCVERAARAVMLHLDPISHAEVVADPAAADRVRLVWQSHSASLSRAAARAGLAGLLELLPDAGNGTSGPGFEALLAHLRKRSRRRRRGPVTALLEQAARRRGLPCEPLAGNYLRLGDGDTQHVVSESCLDRPEAPRADRPDAGPRTRLPRNLYRVLVVGDQLVAAVRLDPPAATDEAGPTVPGAEGTATLEPGTVLRDVHDHVHAEVAARLVAEVAGRGLSVATVDYRADDITHAGRRGLVVALRARPEVTAHLLSGPRARERAGRALLDQVFTTEATGRIPTALVVGTRGTRALVRDLDRFLRTRGEAVGMTTRARSTILGRPVDPSSSGRRVGPEFLLRDPRVALLLAANSPRRILSGGAGLEHVTVTAVLDPVVDPAHVEGVRVALRATTGAVVIDAAHASAEALLAGIETARVVLVTDRRDDPRAREHVAAGGVVVGPAAGPEFRRIELWGANGTVSAIPVSALTRQGGRRNARRRRALFAAALAFGLDRSVGALPPPPDSRPLSAPRH